MCCSSPYSTRCNEVALKLHSFVADNYAPFYSRPIECTDRDAPFVLDSVLYHESDLDLEEHYPDTYSHTEINFAAFVMIGMIGMPFCPAHPRPAPPVHILRRPGARPRHPRPVLQRGRPAVNFRLIPEQQYRIGQFLRAVPRRHTTASDALQKLNRCRCR